MVSEVAALAYGTGLDQRLDEDHPNTRIIANNLNSIKELK
jgi:hypothetical protein